MAAWNGNWLLDLLDNKSCHSFWKRMSRCFLLNRSEQIATCSQLHAKARLTVCLAAHFDTSAAAHPPKVPTKGLEHVEQVDQADDGA